MASFQSYTPPRFVKSTREREREKSRSRPINSKNVENFLPRISRKTILILFKSLLRYTLAFAPLVTRRRYFSRGFAQPERTLTSFEIPASVSRTFSFSDFDQCIFIWRIRGMTLVSCPHLRKKEINSINSNSIQTHFDKRKILPIFRINYNIIGIIIKF